MIDLFYEFKLWIIRYFFVIMLLLTYWNLKFYKTLSPNVSSCDTVILGGPKKKVNLLTTS